MILLSKPIPRAMPTGSTKTGQRPLIIEPACESIPVKSSDRDMVFYLLFIRFLQVGIYGSFLIQPVRYDIEEK